MKYENCKVDLEVYAVEDIIEPDNDCHPTYVLAAKGSKLIIRKISDGKYTNPIHVSHLDVTDSTFAVSPSEITTIDPILTEFDRKQFKKRTGKDASER